MTKEGLMPLRVRKNKINNDNVAIRNEKPKQPRKNLASSRDRAGVTWCLEDPPSALASECERAFRVPNFPEDERGIELKKKYEHLAPLGLTLFTQMLSEYWEGNKAMEKACQEQFFHRLRNAGLKGVGYTSRPNQSAIQAIAPFCHVSLNKLLDYADDLCITPDKKVETRLNGTNISEFTEGEFHIMCSQFVFLLKEAVKLYDNNIQALAIQINLGVQPENRIVSAETIQELLEGRQPTQSECAELAKIIRHPITLLPDEKWLCDTAKLKYRINC